MKSVALFGMILLIAGTVGCTSAEERKAQAEARGAEARATMEEERLRMLKKYNDCVKREGPQASEKCAHLKEAAR